MSMLCEISVCVARNQRQDTTLSLHFVRSMGWAHSVESKAFGAVSVQFVPSMRWNALDVAPHALGRMKGIFRRIGTLCTGQALE